MEKISRKISRMFSRVALRVALRVPFLVFFFSRGGSHTRCHILSLAAVLGCVTLVGLLGVDRRMWARASDRGKRMHLARSSSGQERV